MPVEKGLSEAKIVVVSGHTNPRDDPVSDTWMTFRVHRGVQVQYVLVACDDCFFLSTEPWSLGKYGALFGFFVPTEWVWSKCNPPVVPFEPHLSPAEVFITVDNTGPNADTLGSVNSQYRTSICSRVCFYQIRPPFS